MDTLMQRRRAMMQALGSGSGESGVLDLPWIASRETVTIGANSITNMAQVKTYFAEYQPYFIAVLKTAPTVNNQAVALAVNGASGLRYRGGSISSSGTASNYDGVLVEGSQYDIYHF